MTRNSIVILDLDNTVYDWVSFYIPSFLTMIENLQELTGVDSETLKKSFKRVHEAHRTTEYSFALQELDVLAQKHSGMSARQIYDRYESAIHDFRRKRKETLHAYPGVRKTLRALKGSGSTIVAATESLRYHAVLRLKQLGLERFFDFIASAPDHSLPAGLTAEDIRLYGTDYETTISWIEIPLDVRKPDARFLKLILDVLGANESEAVYVGDSLRRDVLMAQRANVADVFASYGSKVNPKFFEELVKITYWTSADIIADQQLARHQITPTYTIKRFSELLSVPGVFARFSSQPEEKTPNTVSNVVKSKNNRGTLKENRAQ